jgi:phosphomannomutase
MLLVEVILAHKGWGASEWNAGYEDLPNRLLKVEVPDRTIFVAEDAERKLASPEGVQQMVEDAMRKVEMGRAFVRPSGTEDCVRVYAEAKTTPDADGECDRGSLASLAIWHTSDFIYGVFMLTTGLANAVADIVRHVSGQT